MSELEKSFRELSKTENVFLFVPNLIGYGRIFLALLRFGEKSEAARNTFKTQNAAKPPNRRSCQNHCPVSRNIRMIKIISPDSFWFMPTNYVMAAWCYILSGKHY